jgi:crossover junction endodeoxyribonuclease RuvC
MAMTAKEPQTGGGGPPVAGRVVGVDPGLIVTGYAVVDPGARGAFVVEAGVIRTKSARGSLAERLKLIHSGVLEVLDAFPASALALEQVHSHVRHPRTAILMAHARGVIVLAAALRGVPVFGYAAARIKKSLTGSGKAPKEQMQHAIKTELGLDRLPEPHDVADACAVALCHFQIARNQRGLRPGGGEAKNRRATRRRAPVDAEDEPGS